MKDSLKTISKGLLGMVFLSTTVIAAAQESKGSFNVGADVVSSYVWRGVAQGSNEPNIQPSVSYTNGGLTIGVWGSGNLSGSIKEADLYATYAVSSLFSVTLTDYNWTFTPGTSYFKYSNGTDHQFEGTISYAGVACCPLSASINTIFYGADKKASDGKQAYSTYVELGYPIASNAKVFAGASLSESSIYATSGFGVTNVGLKVSKSIEISDKFSLPVYGIAGVNPKAESAFLVVGVTL